MEVCAESEPFWRAGAEVAPEDGNLPPGSSNLWKAADYYLLVSNVSRDDSVPQRRGCQLSDLAVWRLLRFCGRVLVGLGTGGDHLQYIYIYMEILAYVRRRSNTGLGGSCWRRWRSRWGWQRGRCRRRLRVM